MAGLVKAKKYDWKDSNLALFGSDLEKNVRPSLRSTNHINARLGRVSLNYSKTAHFEYIL